MRVVTGALSPRYRPAALLLRYEMRQNLLILWLGAEVVSWVPALQPSPRDHGRH